MKLLTKTESVKVMDQKTIQRIENQRKLNSYRPSNGRLLKTKFGYRDFSFL